MTIRNAVFGTRAFAPIALSLTMLALGAGCGSAWTVVQQSGPPSALRGTNVIVAATDYAQANMDGLPAGQAIGALPADEQADVQNVLGEMQGVFVTELSARAPVGVTAANGPAAPGETRVTMRVLDITRGGHGPFSAATALHVRLSFSVGGQVTDEIEITRQMKWSLTHPSAAQRLRLLVVQVARLGASFLEDELER